MMTPRRLYWLVHEQAPARRERRTARRDRGPARSPEYRAFVRSLPCACCGTTGHVEAAHTGSDGGMAQKASDYSCIPLCPHCHRTARNAYHLLGRAEFEHRHGLNIRDLVRRLNSLWQRRPR